jgi:hypothetical protein
MLCFLKFVCLRATGESSNLVKIADVDKKKKSQRGRNKVTLT